MLRTTSDGEHSGPGFMRWPAWLGPWLAKLRLHAIEPCEAPGQPPMIAKRRRWFGPLLIGPGNLYLRLLGSGVRVLPGAEWRARERALHRALYGIELEAGRRGWLILLIGFWAEAARDPKLQPKFAQRHAGLRAAVGEVVAERAARLDYELPLPADHMATLLIALTNGMAVELLADPAAVPEDLYARALDILLP